VYYYQMAITQKTNHLVLGIMSGTSLDGVDYALCSVGPNQIRLKRLWSVTYPKALRRRILAAASNWLSSYELAQLHHDLGRFYAEKAPKVTFDYIGLHGQTIFHNPKKPHAATSQIGEPAYLAARFNKPVISQFRNMDLAMGGQGAPLATLFHFKVFGKKNQSVAVNNLGGISNVTSLSGNKNLSFDTGPANILIDYAVARLTNNKLSYDEKGKLGAQGIADEGLVKNWLKHPYFSKRPPKSTGREEFGPAFFEKTWKDCKASKLSKEDIVATYTRFTAKSVAEAYGKFLTKFPSLVVLCGGGASNPTLHSYIRRALREKEWELKGDKIKEPVEVVTSEDLGWPSQSIEAAAFALLAYHTVTERPGNLHKTTGATRSVILGQITPSPF
jgi:anhydro-N-acetylmuramic acid kinase